MSRFQESYTHLSDGRAVYFLEEGAGPPFLFVHGGMGDADVARPMFGALRDRFRCIALDRIGYHRSGSLDRVTTLEEQVEAIAEVHSACTSDPLWIFGHSSGGNYSVAYTIAHPNKVRGMVLMEPALYGVFSEESRPPGVIAMIETVVPLLGAGNIDEGIEHFFRTIQPQYSDEVLAEALANALSSERRKYCEALAKDQPLAVSWSPTVSEWAKLSQPTLVIEGDRTEGVLREVAAKVTNLLPNGEKATLRGLDHLAPIKAPDILARTIVEFTNHVASSK